ncbi:uncharacterized protein BDR25DRAFT_361439 [Lindgomyces ingoldianus]|uniref:Uncharacterized protein n=1 Tax=Lindgomyces ingoldianus TaxID=673940 RepID=A0ACB6QEM3_9PLEO|nr:uncharacterized protein BDR25DRAFT_361439 [Lindgomyces ingoldianus]KAF2464600.1 hypothetical protein BDR25DRAFT_361439 [Lindgomyces ingoldianus]
MANDLSLINYFIALFEDFFARAYSSLLALSDADMTFTNALLYTVVCLLVVTYHTYHLRVLCRSIGLAAFCYAVIALDIASILWILDENAAWFAYTGSVYWAPVARLPYPVFECIGQASAHLGAAFGLLATVCRIWGPWAFQLIVCVAFYLAIIAFAISVLKPCSGEDDSEDDTFDLLTAAEIALTIADLEILASAIIPPPCTGGIGYENCAMDRVEQLERLLERRRFDPLFSPLGLRKGSIEHPVSLPTSPQASGPAGGTVCEREGDLVAGSAGKVGLNGVKCSVAPLAIPEWVKQFPTAADWFAGDGGGESCPGYPSVLQRVLEEEEAKAGMTEEFVNESGDGDNFPIFVFSFCSGIFGLFALTEQESYQQNTKNQYQLSLIDMRFRELKLIQHSSSASKARRGTLSPTKSQNENHRLVTYDLEF